VLGSELANMCSLLKISKYDLQTALHFNGSNIGYISESEALKTHYELTTMDILIAINDRLHP
jgi:hypothetical protein